MATPEDIIAFLSSLENLSLPSSVGYKQNVLSALELLSVPPVFPRQLRNHGTQNPRGAVHQQRADTAPSELTENMVDTDHPPLALRPRAALTNEIHPISVEESPEDCAVDRYRQS